MEADVYSADCPSRDLLGVVASKWTALIVGLIANEPRRFGELHRNIEGISSKMLTQTLRALERDGIVIRSIYAEVPPRTDYRLTDLGRSLVPSMQAVREWSESHADDVTMARAQSG